MPPPPSPPVPAPSLTDDQKDLLLTHAATAKQNTEQHKVRHTTHHKFSSAGAGLPSKMKAFIKHPLSASPSSANPNSSPTNPFPTNSSPANPEGIASGSEDTTTGYDGVLEQKQEQGPETEGKGKGKAKEGSGSGEEMHIGRHASYTHVHGGHGMPSKMKERILKK